VKVVVDPESAALINGAPSSVVPARETRPGATEPASLDQPMMIRASSGYHHNDEGEWVAELPCLHGQHIRHRPLARSPWITTAVGRSARLGSAIECLLCDRAELPKGLSLRRSAGSSTSRRFRRTCGARTESARAPKDYCASSTAVRVSTRTSLPRSTSTSPLGVPADSAGRAASRRDHQATVRARSRVALAS
jgi:hypothetical protein